MSLVKKVEIALRINKSKREHCELNDKFRSLAQEFNASTRDVNITESIVYDVEDTGAQSVESTETKRMTVACFEGLPDSVNKNLDSFIQQMSRLITAVGASTKDYPEMVRFDYLERNI